MVKQSRKQSTNGGNERRARSRFLWLRRLAWLFGLFVVVSMIAFWYVTRPSFILSHVVPELSRKLGGPVTIRNAEYVGAGRFRLEDVVIHAPTVTGPAGEVASIRRAEMTLDLSSLLRGAVRIVDVMLQGVTIRISEQFDTPGVFNLMSLQPDWRAEQMANAVSPPQILLKDALIEFGYHEQSEFVRLGLRRVVGEMLPSAQAPGWYNFELREMDALHGGAKADGLNVLGRWSVTSNELTTKVSGLELDASTYNTTPSLVRLWWDRLELDGRVAMQMQWLRSEPFRILFDLQNVSMTLPVEIEGLWSRYRSGRVEASPGRPRLIEASGRLRLDSSELVLEGLSGKIVGSEETSGLVPLPCRIDARVGDLPSFTLEQWDRRAEWMDSAVARCPFEMRVQIDSFSLSTEDAAQDRAVELPLALTQFFEQFQLSNWSLSTQFTVLRLPVDKGNQDEAEPPISWRGQAFISNASGAYHRFPYLLEQVEAYVEYDNDQVTLHELKGVGSGGALATVRGSIAPPTAEAAITMQIRAENVPLDERLRNALEPTLRHTYDALLDATRWHRAISVFGGPVDQGFKPGGSLDVNIQVERKFGRHVEPKVTGSIWSRQIGLIHDRFEYPFVIEDAQFDLSESGIALKSRATGSAISVLTPAGGAGVLTGNLRRVQRDGTTEFVPELSFSLLGERYTPMLEAAIPKDQQANATVSGDISPTGRVLRDFGVSGTVDAEGRIGPSDEDPSAYRVAVTLRDGAVMPLPGSARSAGAVGWPQALSLSEVEARVVVEPHQVTIERASGRRSEGLVLATGTVTHGNGAGTIATDIDLRFAAMPIESYLIDLAPADRRNTAREVWDRFSPRGSFDASLRLVIGADGSWQPFRVTLEPREVFLRIGGDMMSLTREQGYVAVESGQIQLDDMKVRLRSANSEHGAVALNGFVGLAEDFGPIHLTGQWEGGTFGSPAIVELMNLLGAKDAAVHYVAAKPRGEFEASFHYLRDTDSQTPDFEVSLMPRRVQFRVREQPIDLRMKAGSIARITAEGIRLENIRGTCNDATFDVNGKLTFGDAIESEFQFNYDGKIGSDEVRALLPRDAARTLAGLELIEAEPTRVRDGRLKVVDWKDDRQGDDRVIFSGRFDVNNCALSAGVDLTRVSGRCEVMIDGSNKRTPEVRIVAQGMRARTMTQTLRGIQARLEQPAGGEFLKIREFLADVYGGTMWASGQIGVGDRRDFQVRVGIAGASLSGMMHERADEQSNADGRSNADRGQVYADMSIAGRRMEPHSRRGRGEVRIADGRIVDVPIALQLAQLLQFSIPGSGGLNYADAKFYIDGDQVTLERVTLESVQNDQRAQLQVEGSGTMQLPGLDLDLQLRTRSAILIVRDIIGGLSDQLYQIRVTGTLLEPEASLLALPNLRGSARAGVEP